MDKVEIKLLVLLVNEYLRLVNIYKAPKDVRIPLVGHFYLFFLGGGTDRTLPLIVVVFCSNFVTGADG